MAEFSQTVFQITIQEWHQFAEGFENRHVFHHAGWIRALQETYHFPLRIYAVKEPATGAILTALPFMQVTSLKGVRKWLCLPFTDFFPVLGDLQKAVDLVKFLHGEKILKGVVEVRFALPEDPSFHYATHQVMHTIDLRTDEETVSAGIWKNHIKAIRQAEQRGTQVDFLATLSAMKKFYAMHLITRRDKGLPTQPWKFFKKIYEQLIAEGQNGYVVLARNKFIEIGGEVVLYWGKVLTGKFNASDGAYLRFRPNHMLYWHTILWGIEHNFPTYDLGKTTTDNEGLCRFKAGWTAVEHPLRYTYLGVDDDIEMSEPTNSGLMAVVSTLIQKSPVSVSRLVGAFFYRFFV